MLEKSASYALNNSVHAFRVPTVDNLGAIKFYDVKIDLLLNPNGTIQSTANVTATASLNIGTVNIVPGTYQESNGTDKCNVTNIKLINGRTESLFKCTNGGTAVFEFTVVSGLISNGHPFLTPLTTFKINTRTDATTQNWGMVSTGFFNLGVCTTGSSAGAAPSPIGAFTNGNQLVLTLIATTVANAPTTKCTTMLSKLP